MKKLILIISMLFIITSCSSLENKKIESDQIIFENNIKCNSLTMDGKKTELIFYNKYSNNLNTCIRLTYDWHYNYLKNMFTWEILFKCAEEEENCKQNTLSKFKNY